MRALSSLQERQDSEWQLAQASFKFVRWLACVADDDPSDRLTTRVWIGGRVLKSKFVQEQAVSQLL